MFPAVRALRCEQCHTVPIVQPQPPSGQRQSQTNPPSSSHVSVYHKNMERREELWQSCWWGVQIAGPRFNYIPLPAQSGNLEWHQQILGTWTTAFKRSYRSSQLLPPPVWHRCFFCAPWAHIPARREPSHGWEPGLCNKNHSHKRPNERHSSHWRRTHAHPFIALQTENST